MKMENRLKALLAGLSLLALTWVTSAHAAATTILIPAQIPYKEADTANDDVRKECDWNSKMPRYLAAESEGLVRVSDAPLAESKEKKLLLVATHLHTAGGGGFSGPKWLVLEGELFEGGKLLGNFQVRRQTMRGSLRGCNTLVSLGEEITKDILEWLEDPVMNAKLGDAK